MPPATQQPTNQAAASAARLKRHQPYHKQHPPSSNVYKRHQHYHEKYCQGPASSNVYKRRDPDPASPFIDKRCDNVSKRSDDEAYARVLSQVLYCGWCSMMCLFC